jgi:hypothetical protein
MGSEGDTAGGDEPSWSQFLINATMIARGFRIETAHGIVESNRLKKLFQVYVNEL